MSNKTLLVTLSDGSKHTIDVEIHLPYELDKLPKWIKTSESNFINKDHIVVVEKV